VRSRRAGAAIVGATLLGAGLAWGTAASHALAEANALLFRRLQAVHHLSDAQMRAVEAVFAGSPFLGQGNPAIAHHPMSEARCRSELAERHVSYADPEFERICGGPYMAPLYDPARQKPEDATACIDQFEFPDIPCTYPVVWVRAREAAELCEAEGKRLCDAHEWEGACAGALEPPDYRWDLARGVAPGVAIERMRRAHNQTDAPTKTWSYGPAYREGVCATSSHKSPGCNGGGWNRCGSNTFPAGAFPACHSRLGVYDLNGNAAEHMNLPLDPSQMASHGSRTLGYTEMKGSWFVFDDFRAHPDWCRWRAPFWHGSRVMDPHSHENYHLGFRCCKTLHPAGAR
jgi:formylglycine-generating enzyme required for sulfatase activity